MAETEKVELEALPPHVLEHIFCFIPLPEIVRLSVTCPLFLAVSDSVIRKKFFELHSVIYREFKILKNEIEVLPKTDDFMGDRISLLRCYYSLEVLVSELNLIRAVWRKILYNLGGSSVPIGNLLHEFYSAFYMMKRRCLPPWHINDETEGKIIKNAKFFFECKLQDLQLDQMFGSQMMDILDTMINRQYLINVKYHPEYNKCIIDAVYKLRKPHFLNRPPKIGISGKTTLEDRKRILSYLVSLVRINNRVTLREEQYHRETEASRSSELSILALEIELLQTGSAQWIHRNVRVYESAFSNPVREQRKVGDICEFEETYRSPEFNHSTNIEKKFICNIQIKCSLNEAPLTIKDCWTKLKSDLMSQLYAHSDLEFLEESFDRMPCFSKEDYMLQCTMEVCASATHNNFEIFRLTINDP